MPSDEETGSVRPSPRLVRLGSAQVARAGVRAAALRRSMTSKMERLVNGFDDAPFTTDREKEVAAATSTVAEGVWTNIGKVLKKALTFAGPSYAEAMGCNEYASEPSVAGKASENSNCDGRLSARSSDQSADTARSTVLEDGAGREKGTAKRMFGEVELQSVIETTAISDINEGDEITTEPNSDRSGPSTSGACSSGASSSEVSASEASTSGASAPASSYPVAEEV